MKKRILSVFLTLTLVIGFIIPFIARADEGITVTYGEESETFLINSNNISDAFSSAFNFCNYTQAEHFDIKVPAGTYTVEYPVTVSSNTTLDLSDVVLINENSNIFKTQSDVKAYNGTHDFKVIGGEFTYVKEYDGTSCLVRMAHAKNIEFNGSVFSNNKNSHHVELAACNNVLFENCTFKNMEGSISNTSGEALQIDILEESQHFALMPEYDGTMNQNITVNKCTFSNLLRGVGTQSAFAGLYHKNIKIINCEFNNILSTAISCTNYINSTISNNKITKCGEGIHFYMMKTDSSLNNMCVISGKGSINKDCSSVISNNTISVSKTAGASTASPIFIYGSNITKDKGVNFPTGNYYVGNIKVTGNTLTSNDVGIRMYDVKKSTIYKNTINGGTKNSGIYVDADCDSNTIEENIIKGFEHGINIKNKSDSNTVLRNQVSSTVKNGVIVQSTCSGNSVSANKITSAGNNGILVDGAKTTSVVANTVTKPKNHGVCLLSAELTKLNKNTINTAGANGIYLDAKTTVKELTSNSISSSKSNGISAYGSISKVSSNTFTSNQWGIYFAPGTKATLYNNTYTSNAKGAGYNAGSTNSYKFSNLSKPSPTLSQKSKTVTVKWKKITNATNYEIYRATKKDGTYTKIKTVSSKTLSYKDAKRTKGKTYYYKVRAVRKMNSITQYSSYSLIKSIKIK
ncbi:MAG: hypothetical protein E7570_04050 [Ruminococcaceae bacterium]|nr:hypothetical protein [Oscillospiraceae bacterium]